MQQQTLSVSFLKWVFTLRWIHLHQLLVHLSPEIVGEEHYDVARQVQQTLQRYKELQDIIAILGMDELSDEDKLIVAPCTSYSILLITKLPRC